MSHPYANLDPTAFWRTAVAERAGNVLEGLWQPKWTVGSGDPIATFGSCFAQHLGPALRSRGLTWCETEPPPRGLDPANARRFGYSRFSARTGNLYTPSLLRQWVGWAIGEDGPPSEHWLQDGRSVDPFRPLIEPEGFVTLDEMLASRRQAIDSFRCAIESAEVLVFTLGLTESWFHTSGWEYPSCPGTVAGEHDPTVHRFVQLSFHEAHRALVEAIERMQAIRSDLRVLLTVSPVPLTATRSGRHVLAATTESKSILRALAGQLARRRPNVDYFPAYELVTAPTFGGAFYEANQRSVSRQGVDFVLAAFFRAQGIADEAAPPDCAPVGKPERAPADDDDALCEEAWLEAFAL